MAERLLEVAPRWPSRSTATSSRRRPQPTSDRITRRRLIWRRFLRNKTAVVGAVIILLLIVIAVIGPYITPWAYDEIDRRAYLEPPSEEHWLGTTQSGRDMLALTLRGLRKSLLIGLLVAVISTGSRRSVGSFAAYFGGWFERIALWVIDLLLVIPAFLLIALITTGGPKGPYSWLLLVAAARRLPLDAVRPGGARPDDVDQGARVRPGGPVHGGVRAEDHRPAHPARTSPRC